MEALFRPTKDKGHRSALVGTNESCRSVGRDVPSHTGRGNHEDNESGNDHVGFLRLHDSKISIGQIANKVTTSQTLNGLWPVSPTTPPMKAEAAMVSIKRANPSFCSLLYFDGMVLCIPGAAPP